MRSQPSPIELHSDRISLAYSGQLVDIRRRLEALGARERVGDGGAELLDGLKRHAAARGALRRAAERILLEDGAGKPEQEELDESRNHGLAALALDLVDDLVVRRGMELHQDLADHADARLGALALQGSVSKSSTICLTVFLNRRASRPFRAAPCTSPSNDRTGSSRFAAPPRRGACGTHCMSKSP